MNGTYFKTFFPPSFLPSFLPSFPSSPKPYYHLHTWNVALFVVFLVLSFFLLHNIILARVFQIYSFKLKETALKRNEYRDVCPPCFIASLPPLLPPSSFLPGFRFQARYHRVRFRNLNL